MKWRKIAVHISVSFTGMLHTFVFINPATQRGRRERERGDNDYERIRALCEAAPRNFITVFQARGDPPLCHDYHEKGKFTKVPCTGELFLNYRLARDQRG